MVWWKLKRHKAQELVQSMHAVRKIMKSSLFGEEIVMEEVQIGLPRVQISNLTLTP